MDSQLIEEILGNTIKCFLEKEIDLFSIDANERSLTHKFAEYLQIFVGDVWKVDCEYNRYGDEPKKLDEIKNIVGNNTTTDKIKSKTVYPDIIIHKRGQLGHNLLVIEAKKDPTHKEEIIDTNKLKKIQEKYRYDFAIFLIFDIVQKQITYKFIQ